MRDWGQGEVRELVQGQAAQESRAGGRMVGSRLLSNVLIHVFTLAAENRFVRRSEHLLSLDC